MVDTTHLKVGSFMMVGGALLGAGIGLLLAPKSGQETREQLSDYAREARMQASTLGDRVKQQINEVKVKVEEYLPMERMPG